METLILVMVAIAGVAGVLYGVLGYRMSKFLDLDHVMKAVNSKFIFKEDYEKLPESVKSLYQFTESTELICIIGLFPMTIYGVGGTMLFFQPECLQHLIIYGVGVIILLGVSRVGAFIGCCFAPEEETLESA